MLETIRTSRYSDGRVRSLLKYSVTLVLLIVLLSSPVTAVGETTTAGAATPEASSAKPKPPFDPIHIAKALTDPPNVPQPPQDLARDFLDQTLPRMLTDDERLVQLGFNDGLSNQITIERVFSIMVIRRADLLEAIERKTNPLELVNNINNWRLEDGRLVPRRIIFLLKGGNSPPESDDYSWSSVILEQSQQGSWRIFQVGAPKLSRAMNRHAKIESTYFLLWLPDLNRHYLGQIKFSDDGLKPKIVLTTLFDDRLIRIKDANGSRTRKAGEEFDASSEEFFKRMRELYEDLDLPKKIPRKSDEERQPTPAHGR
jgi:hypothetical protein